MRMRSIDSPYIVNQNKLFTTDEPDTIIFLIDLHTQKRRKPLEAWNIYSQFVNVDNAITKALRKNRLHRGSMKWIRKSSISYSIVTNVKRETS